MVSFRTTRYARATFIVQTPHETFIALIIKRYTTSYTILYPLNTKTNG